MNVLVSVSILITVALASSADYCVSRDYGNDGTVCVCNAEHCHTLNSIEKVEETKYVKVTSNKEGLRFQQEEGTFVETDTSIDNVVVIGNETYQEIFGFGGAFTDSTGININSLDEEMQEKLMRSYFSDEGLEYSVGRVPIGGTDFSTEGYSYCDTDDADPDLIQFNLTTADYEYKIPLIHKALELRNNELDLFASAWIAPNWMKTIPGFTSRLSFIKDEYYQTWANYFVKFLDAYKNNNISFWAITTGNEPLTTIAPTKIPTVGWTPQGLMKWIKNNLGPTIRNSSYSDIKLITLDDQRILLPWVIDLMFGDEDVKNYIDGIGVHWYQDAISKPKVLTETHENFPDKFLFATEACNGYLLVHVLLGSWERGEAYANSILEDLNHWMTGWMDWNMALNLEGGPTFIKNFVDSPIIVNATAGEFYKQPTYYALGHFSKFIPKGSLRLERTTFDDDIPVGAFRRADGGTAVIILNKKDTEVSATIRDAAMGDINLILTPKSITSIVYW